MVTVRAVEQDGRAGTARIEIDVSPRPPLNVNLTADPLRATVGEVVVFTAAVSGSTVPIARYERSFGDGSRVTTTGNVVNHVYDRAATPEAEVRVVNQDGQTGVGRTTVEVTPPAPLNVNLTVDPLRAAVGEVVVFTATVSGSTVPITRYEWDFGDGTRITATGNVVNHVYRTAGTREAQVQVVDRDGQTGVGRTTIEVTPRALLNVNLTADPPRPTAGDIVVFSATVTGSTVPIARYEWDFGDGASVTTTGNVVDHVYTTTGARTARVTVFSIENDRGTSQTTLIVAPPRLAVTLVVAPVVADAGQPITFTATVSPATAVIVRYEWSFGDAGENTADTTAPRRRSPTPTRTAGRPGPSPSPPSPSTTPRSPPRGRSRSTRSPSALMPTGATGATGATGVGGPGRRVAAISSARSPGQRRGRRTVGTRRRGRGRRAPTRPSVAGSG